MTFKAADLHPGIVATCFVCVATLDQMLEALGADESERRLLKGQREAPAPTAVRHFLYHDREGVVRFRVERRERPGHDKEFHQERPDGAGGWIKDLKGVTRVPYRLPEVLAAIGRGEAVWFAEGETNVDDLVALGLAATCNPGGAEKWKDDYSRELTGLARAVICADHDEPGTRHAAKVAQSLSHHGVTEITIVAFPGPKSNDVSDWLRDQPVDTRRERLLDYVKREGRPPARNGGPPRGAVTSAAAKRPPLTDLGNAERLVLLHGHDLRYVHAWGRWLVWDSRRWRTDQGGEVVARAIETVRAIYAEAMANPDPDQRKAIARHATKSEGSARIAAIVTLAETLRPITPDHLDANPWDLNVENGTIDLRTGTLRPHRREDLITKLAPVAFDPGARHDLWDRFLERMVPDPELRSFMRRAAGYTLTGDTGEEKLFFIHGPTASGKSTFAAALSSLLGDYAATCNFDTFLQRDHGNDAATDLARLPGVRMAISLEVDEGRKLAVAVLKSITGRDRIPARFLYQNFFEYTPAFKLWLVANDKPHANATDNALWRRILMVPFEQTLTTKEQDPSLKATLLSDPMARSAILTWAVAGLGAWRELGLRPSSAVENATRMYRQEQDSVAEFLADCCVTGSLHTVTNPKLRKAYETWCSENGERPMSPKALALRLHHHGCKPFRNNSVRGWEGVRLRDPLEGDAGW